MYGSIINSPRDRDCAVATRTIIVIVQSLMSLKVYPEPYPPSKQIYIVHPYFELQQKLEQIKMTSFSMYTRGVCETV